VGRAVRALARAGCRLIQLRGKELTALELHRWSLEAVEAAREVGVEIVVNDRADVALAVGAAGVHVGQDDLSPSLARKVLGPDAIVGCSTHSVDEAREADRGPASYVAIGPVFATPTKTSPYHPLGPEGVARVRQAVSKPLVAIGGISEDNGRAVVDAGADSLAVISALMSASDLDAAARRLMETWAR
jgi:thiamine-phosphate pyrophosphorylase